MVKILKFLIALLLLPTAFFGAAEAGRVAWRVLADWHNSLSLIVGAGVFIILFIAGLRGNWLYVWGHETTHAVAAMLFGFRVHAIEVRQDSGYVKMNGCNAFVALAPYVVPVFTLCIGMLYAAISLFADPSALQMYFMGAVGFFTAFHWLHTWRTLWETDQPDLCMAGGRVFSAVMIILGNTAVLLLTFKCLFPVQVNLSGVARATAYGTYNTWQIVINYIVELFGSWL